MTIVQSLAATVGLLFVGLAVYSHKFKHNRVKPLLGDLEISGRLMLTQKTALVLVRVSGRPVLCAVGPENVSLLNAEPDVRAETAFYELVGRRDPTDEVLS
jgi:flagellar biogenesis protein FliO